MLVNLAFQPLNMELWNKKDDSINFANDKMLNISHSHIVAPAASG